MAASLPAEPRALQAQPLAEEAFQRVYESTAGPILAYLVAGCGRRDVAEDLLQEIFCRLLLRWPSLAGEVAGPAADPSALRRYLFRIATNLLHDRWRSGEAQPFAEPAEETAPSRSLDSGMETGVDVRAMLGQLKPRERELLWLAYVEGMDHAEISAATGLGRLSVRTLLFRARGKARAFLQARAAGPAPVLDRTHASVPKGVAR